MGVDGWEKEIGLFCVKSGVGGGPPRRPRGGGFGPLVDAYFERLRRNIAKPTF